VASQDDQTPVKHRVIVADDDPTIQRAIEWIVRRSCDVIRKVSAGEDLVEAALALQPDVIIADVMMPAFFGCEALRRLRTAGPFALVLVSDELQDLRQWIEQGATCVVHTMDLDSDLPKAVEAAAVGRRFISRSCDCRAQTGLC
jgi:DNA-binding NarL/FixJ family response regulator